MKLKKRQILFFSKLGLTTSQAIMLFLTASVNKNGIPFELSFPRETEQDLEFATLIASLGGVEPTDEAKRLFLLYKRGEIDLETVKFAIKRLHEK